MKVLHKQIIHDVKKIMIFLHHLIRHVSILNLFLLIISYHLDTFLC